MRSELHRSRQSNVRAYCLLATEYDIPSMLRTVDIWLAEHCELALPSLPPRRNTHPRGFFCKYARFAAKVYPRNLAVQVFKPILTLMREYKLKRFEEAATQRIDKLCETYPKTRTTCDLCRHWPDGR